MSRERTDSQRNSAAPAAPAKAGVGPAPPDQAPAAPVASTPPPSHAAPAWLDDPPQRLAKFLVHTTPPTGKLCPGRVPGRGCGGRLRLVGPHAAAAYRQILSPGDALALDEVDELSTSAPAPAPVTGAAWRVVEGRDRWQCRGRDGRSPGCGFRWEHPGAVWRAPRLRLEARRGHGVVLVTPPCALDVAARWGGVVGLLRAVGLRGPADAGKALTAACARRGETAPGREAAARRETVGDSGADGANDTDGVGEGGDDAEAVAAHALDPRPLDRDLVEAVVPLSALAGVQKRLAVLNFLDPCLPGPAPGVAAALDGRPLQPRADEAEVARRLAAVPPCLFSLLLPFQREAVRFALERHGRFLLADEMGAGKSIQGELVGQVGRTPIAAWPNTSSVPAPLSSAPLAPFHPPSQPLPSPRPIATTGRS